MQIVDFEMRNKEKGVALAFLPAHRQVLPTRNRFSPLFFFCSRGPKGAEKLYAPVSCIEQEEHER